MFVFAPTSTSSFSFVITDWKAFTTSKVGLITKPAPIQKPVSCQNHLNFEIPFPHEFFPIS